MAKKYRYGISTDLPDQRVPNNYHNPVAVKGIPTEHRLLWLPSHPGLKMLGKTVDQQGIGERFYQHVGTLFVQKIQNRIDGRVSVWGKNLHRLFG